MKRDRWASDGSSESESEAQSRPKSDAQSRPKVRRDDERTGTPENRASARPAAHELAESDRNGDDHHAIGLDGEVDGSRARALDAGDGAEANGAESVDVRDTAGAAVPRVHNPLMHGCRSVEQYERLSRIDEGTYGVVYRARCKQSGAIVALKQVKMSPDAAKEGFPITALRETNVLLSLNHPNIINVHEMVVGTQMDRVYMVMEFFDYDLKSAMQLIEHPWSQARAFRALGVSLSQQSPCRDSVPARGRPRSSACCGSC